MLNAQWQAISETFKVHKHDIFLMNFLQKPKPYGPKGL